MPVRRRLNIPNLHFESFCTSVLCSFFGNNDPLSRRAKTGHSTLLSFIVALFVLVFPCHSDFVHAVFRMVFTKRKQEEWKFCESFIRPRCFVISSSSSSMPTN